MSNRNVQHVWPRGLNKPAKSAFRVYAQLDDGALMVRQSSSQNLNLALHKVAKLANALAWEIREFRNGVERLIQVDEVTL